MASNPNPFPNLIPFRHPLPRGFKLSPDLQAGGLPVTPAIPPTVATGDVITALHENTVTTALGDLWTNEQWLAANALADPTTTKGDMVARSAAALTRLPVGANGSVLLADSAQTTGVRWGSLDAAAVGGVPITRLIIAGAGMSGGGSLSVDVTLNANVVTVFGRTGAVAAAGGDYTAAQVTNAVSTIGSYADPIWLTALAWAKITGAPSFVPATRQVIAGTGLAGGGALSADVTLTALPMGASGPASHAAGMVPDPGATAGGTRYLREDATWAIPAGAGGGLTDPTTTLGDLIVRGASAPTRLGVGANGQILMADSAQPTGIKWAAAGAGAQTPWTSDIDAASHNLNNVAGIGLGMAAVANTGVIVSGAAFFDGFQQLNNSPTGWAGFTGQNDTGATFAFRIYGSGQVQANLAQLEASGAMTFVTAAAERMRITAAGNVGFGTPSPQARLDVYVPSGIAAPLRIQNAGAGATDTAGLELLGGGVNCAWAIFTNRPDVLGVADTLCVYKSLGTAGVKLAIKDNGNVGIGTPAPTGPLDVVAAASNSRVNVTLANNGAAGLNSRIRLRLGLHGGFIGTDVYPYMESYADDSDGNQCGLAFGTYYGGLVERMRITALGNVGIGTATPLSHLVVTAPSAAYNGDGMAGHFQITTGTGGQLDEKLHMGIVDGSHAWIQAVKPGTLARNIVLQPGGGFVGIGTATPLAPLDVATNIPKTGGNAYVLRLKTAEADAAGPFDLKINVTGGATNADRSVGFQTGDHNLINGGNLLFQQWGGRVGIGTGLPYQTVSIIPAGGNGTTVATSMQLSMGEVTNNPDYRLSLGFGYITGNHRAVIQSYQGTPAAGILCLQPSGGNVSIGSNLAPGYALDVAGDINASGAVRVAGVALTSGGFTTKSVNTPGRAVNTNYQNAYGKPMFISVTGNVTTGNFMQLLTDATATPAAGSIAAAVTNGSASTLAMTVAGWVMPGHYFKINVTGFTMSMWIEWY